MTSRSLSALSVLALTASLLGAAGSPAGAQDGSDTDFTDGRYIVTFVDEPVASYEGYVPGFAATRPGRGQKLNAASPAAQRWQQRLTAIHDAALARVGATKLYDYTVTNNGVAANLTARQAARLAKTPGVIALAKDELRQLTTTSSSEFLGLGNPGGMWSQLGGNASAGAGVVVGVIDTGIWPESKAFAGGTGIPVPSGWRGRCAAGELFATRACNDKLVGARYYIEGFGRAFIAVDDYQSPRDGNGHGSHTASTAAGNRVTDITIDGKVIDDNTGSGMAPGA